MTREHLNSICVKCAAIFAALFVCHGAVAEDVTVTSTHGNLALTGRVIGFDGQYLQLESPYGPLTLNYARVQCDGAACPDPATYVPTIRMSGAARMVDVLMPALIDGYARATGLQIVTESSNSDRITLLLSDGDAQIARFTLHGTTSEEGFADLMSFQSDFALSLREVRSTEKELAATVGIGVLDAPGQSRIVGLDALIPIVAPGTDHTELSLRDIEAIFKGDVRNWSAFGGADEVITLHLGPERDGHVQLLSDAFGLNSRPVYHDSTAEMAAAVARDRNGLGIGSLGETSVAQPVAIRDACGFVAQPRRTAIKTQDYPLSAPLFIYLPDWRLHPMAHDFLAYLRTPAAQLIVRRAGFIDQGAVPVPLDAQGQRFVSAIAAAGPEVDLSELQRMVRILTALTRQSVSFRFEVGSTRLDAGSRSNLLLLAQAVRDGDYANRALWLIGFSDGRGAAKANRDLSSARAEAVKRDLLEILGDDLPADMTLETEAFGEALPMGCDDTEWGRQINRRVELWVSE